MSYQRCDAKQRRKSAFVPRSITRHNQISILTFTVSRNQVNLFNTSLFHKKLSHIFTRFTNTAYFDGLEMAPFKVIYLHK